MNNEQKIIKSFKKTQDYRDICYMIDHITMYDIMISCIEDLNYKIGLNILTSKEKGNIKNITLGKKGEIRIQLTKTKNNCNICAIIENFKTNIN